MINRLFGALIFLCIVFFGWYLVAIQPVTRSKVPTQSFEIPSGSGLDTIIERLSREKLVRSRTAFKITVLRMGLSSKLQAGYFQLSPAMSASQLAVALTKAYAKQVRVTIPEGLRAEEVNNIISKSFSTISNSKFSSSEFSKLSKNREGELFPETYDFVETASTEDVFNKLTSQHQKTLNELKISDPKVVIIASLLEREAANKDEMPLIAGVVEKRLKNNWPLQIDATVQYALTSKSCKKLDCDWWPKSLSLADLQINSPYNTYKNQGLPPAPISNPGKDALSAAANPKDSTAWFYLHGLDGTIRFADTIEQHNKNICTYLKKDCN